MGCCCSTEKKPPAEPAKRNELVRSSVDQPAKEPVSNTTYNVITETKKTEISTVVITSDSETTETTETTKGETCKTETTKTETKSATIHIEVKKEGQTTPPLHPPSHSNKESNKDSTKSFFSAMEGSPRESGLTDVSAEPSPVSRTSESALLASRFLSAAKRGGTSSGNSSRSSSFSGVKKEHREFRFFLPILDVTEDWLPSEVSTKYNEALHKLQSTLRDADISASIDEAETVNETYLIARSYFGLKYLDDKKLEMRVKTENTPIWMEKWSKVRFGKKAIGHYKNDIVSYLYDVGHKDPSIEKVIDEPHFISVQRKTKLSAPTGIEVSELIVPSEQSQFNGQIKRNRWLTVSMASDSNKIEEFVWNHHQDGENSLWEVVELSRNIVVMHTEAAVNHSFVPIFSGYPLWIKLIANAYSTTADLTDQCIPPVESFLTFFNEEPTTYY